MSGSANSARARCDEHVGEAHAPRCYECDDAIAQAQRALQAAKSAGVMCPFHFGFTIPCGLCAVGHEPAPSTSIWDIVKVLPSRTEDTLAFVTLAHSLTEVRVRHSPHLTSTAWRGDACGRFPTPECPHCEALDTVMKKERSMA